MTSITKTKLIAYLTFIFIAGAVSGGILGWKKGRVRSAPPVTMEKVCRSVEDRLKARLELSGEQLEAIQPILDQTAHKLKKAHARSLWDIEQILCWRSDEMAKFLSPEQVQKLEAFDAERHEGKENPFKDGKSKTSREK